MTVSQFISRFNSFGRLKLRIEPGEVPALSPPKGQVFRRATERRRAGSPRGGPALQTRLERQRLQLRLSLGATDRFATKHGLQKTGLSRIGLKGTVVVWPHAEHTTSCS